MTESWHCDNTLRELFARRLAEFEFHSPPYLHPAAAVALPVVEAGFGADLSGMPKHDGWSQAAALLLTRRSSRLKDHPGQWALPGGRVDAGETVTQAALRELHEEVGLELGEAAIIGRLDDYVTRSGFRISGVVVWIGADAEPNPNPDEVDSVHRIPVTEFLREDAPLLNYGAGEDSVDNPVLRMPVGDNWIAAPTAALLYQFREVCLRGQHTRVAHFDQPRFAWR